MQVTVFGASGKVGQQVVKKLLEQGHTVQVFVHRSSPFDASENLKIIKSDIHNAAFVESAVRGSDVVISTLGSWHTKTKDILSAAMRFIIPAMQQQGVTRIITLTGSAALAPGDTPTRGTRIAHKLFSFTAKDIIRDAEEHLRLLAESNLDWTTLRAPIMRNGGTALYTLNNKVPTITETIPRLAVAQAIVDQITDTSQMQLAPQLHRD